MQEHFFYNGLLVSYGDKGSGLPILFIHGFAEDHGVWNEQVDFLRHEYRVISVDLPGSGESAYNANLYTIEDFADVVHAVLQRENIDQCVMLGHSMGGYIVLAFAEKYPQELLGFGLVHSTALADSEEKKQARLKGIKTIGENGPAEFVKNTTPGLFTASYKEQHPEKIEALVEKGAAFTPQALQQYYRAMMERPNRTSVLQNSPVPVLFIIGTEDVAVPLADSLKQAHLPAVAHIHILEDTCHMGFWEQAGKTNGYIAEFAGFVAAATH